jgi:hypothetical protein
LRTAGQAAFLTQGASGHNLEYGEVAVGREAHGTAEREVGATYFRRYLFMALPNLWMSSKEVGEHRSFGDEIDGKHSSG